MELLQGEKALLKAGLAYGRAFLARCIQAYSPFINSSDVDLMTVDSDSDSVVDEDLTDMLDDSDFDDH